MWCSPVAAVGRWVGWLWEHAWEAKWAQGVGGHGGWGAGRGGSPSELPAHPFRIQNCPYTRSEFSQIRRHSSSRSVSRISAIPRTV